MPKFEDRFVHFTWDESLKDKRCFVADDISKLKSEFKDGCRETVIDCSDEDFPFETEGNYFRFAYYDPRYDVKVAYEEGKQIQYKAKDTGRWCDWDDSLSKCIFVDNVEYRVKPEEPKLKWTELRYQVHSFNTDKAMNKFLSTVRKEDVHLIVPVPVASSMEYVVLMKE